MILNQLNLKDLNLGYKSLSFTLIYPPINRPLLENCGDYLIEKCKKKNTVAVKKV